MHQVNWAIIGSDDDLLPVKCEAIIQINAHILVLEPLATNFSDINKTIVIRIQENWFENVIYKMLPILFWSL